jgi:UDP-galactopyranose mutase
MTANHDTEQEQITIICLAHLGWDYVWQRPQQIMSRFAARCRVVYIDPPAYEPLDEQVQLRERIDASGVHVVQPIISDQLQLAPMRRFQEYFQILQRIMEQSPSVTILWLYVLEALPLVESLASQLDLIVYDCMDDFHSLDNSPAGERQRQLETRVIDLADLLFTAGRSMYEARKDRHPLAYCFSAGIDLPHFKAACDPALPLAAALDSIPCPRFGYFGVLDDRLDWQLVAAVARQRPDWQWVFVGPKFHQWHAELPQAHNIHYLGQQPYRDLPAYLKGFDICTMPFVLSDHTRFLHPTKILEYLAGDKQVISTSLPDAVAMYGGIISFGDSVEAWLEVGEKLLGTTPEQRIIFQVQVAPLLEQSSWDGIVTQMWELMWEQFEEEGP